jgi:hypothetical protein
MINWLRSRFKYPRYYPPQFHNKGQLVDVRKGLWQRLVLRTWWEWRPGPHPWQEGMVDYKPWLVPLGFAAGLAMIFAVLFAKL